MSVKILDDANYNTKLMERPTEMSQSEENQVKLPSGVLNPKEWENCKISRTDLMQKSLAKKKSRV